MEQQMDDDAVNAAVRDKVKVFGDYVEIQRSEESGTAEKRKVYVSNLDVGVDKPLLRQVFGHYGKLREIRLVLRQSIAFAYIEFEIGRSAENAIELDGKTIPGFTARKIGVAIAEKNKTNCGPDIYWPRFLHKKREADLKELFVTNFTIATTKQDLQGLFEKYGKVKDVRLLLDQSGVPRGVAFVEFEDEKSAKSALQVNGTEIDGKFISVARSDPNARGGKPKPDRDGGDREGGQQQNQQQRTRPGMGHPGRGGRGGFGSSASFVPKTASRKMQLKVPAVSGSDSVGNMGFCSHEENRNWPRWTGQESRRFQKDVAREIKFLLPSRSVKSCFSFVSNRAPTHAIYTIWNKTSADAGMQPTDLIGALRSCGGSLPKLELGLIKTMPTTKRYRYQNFVGYNFPQLVNLQPLSFVRAVSYRNDYSVFTSCLNVSMSKRPLEDSKPHYLHSSLRLTSLTDHLPTHPTNADCYSLRDLLSLRPTVAITQMYQFNYLLEPQFFFSHLPTTQPNSKPSPEVIFIVHKNPSHIETVTAMRPKPACKFIFPYLDMYGTHHSKMMVLFYEDGKAHLVIHTANLIDRDWGRKSQMCWISSLLVGKMGKPVGSNSSFGQDLDDYLASYGKELGELRARLQGFDFSREVGQIVASVPGRHDGTARDKWGHLKLNKVLKRDVELSESMKKESTIICQYSSTGSLGSDSSWLVSEFGESLAGIKSSGGSGFFAAAGPVAKKKIALVFPRVSDVRDSLQGWAAGNSIPFGNDLWMKQKGYMMPLLKKWVGVEAERDRAMPHIKTFSRVNETTKAMCRLTSHNLSKAAWGCLEKKGKQLFIRSYEIGVLLSPSYIKTSPSQTVTLKSMTASEYRAVLPELETPQEFASKGREVEDANVIIPIRFPFDLPLTPYDSNDEPWRWDVKFEGFDSHGTKRETK
ncbi:UNVERIFIED_CONTAM: tyrosyl-DNA phosphodiesterase 1 [Siphonaria sp. JEL0065]|nr:tyrosyl-DNA phosphodiesterase 1 [Siphonaria sp. JEL0065]